MIITLKGASFSSNRIGVLDKWNITQVIDTGVTYSGPSSVSKGGSFSATLTLKTGYAYTDGVTVTMSGGGSISKSTSGNVTTISSSNVTGHITIRGLTYNTSTGESSGGETGGSLTAANTNASYCDTANHLHDSQVSGQALKKSSVGTKGIYGWDIPKNALVTLTVSGGGNYGMAITDSNDIVIECMKNSDVAPNAGDEATYTFTPVVQASRLYVSTTKFVSASYVVLSDAELSNYAFNIQLPTTSESGVYIGTSQTVGSAVKIAEMGGTYYLISNEIPANTITTINVKTGGSYGMCIADLSGNVLESKPSATADADGNIVFSKQTVPYKLWVSKTKFNKATYRFA